MERSRARDKARGGGRPASVVPGLERHQASLEALAKERPKARFTSSRERFATLLRDLPPGIALLDEHGEAAPRGQVLAGIAESQDVDFSSWRMVSTGLAELHPGAKP